MVSKARVMPRYPIYIPSKGRYEKCMTAECLRKENVPFTLVVEQSEYELYAARFGAESVLVLPPPGGLGSSVPARNFIWQQARLHKAERHWCLDDNIRCFYRHYAGKRLYCDAAAALAVCEDFTDRYGNVAISGLNYYMNCPDDRKILPVQANCHVYSCMLINTSIPYAWRGRYNEDTDLCLQVLSSGEWCTVLLNTFLCHKQRTLTMKGGNTDVLYKGDGRLKMARSLERLWPGVVETKRRFGRPQHYVKDSWKRFDTPLQLKPGVRIDASKTDEYGLVLQQVAPVVRSPRLKKLLSEHAEVRAHGKA